MAQQAIPPPALVHILAAPFATRLPVNVTGKTEEDSGALHPGGRPEKLRLLISDQLRSGSSGE